VNRWIESTFGSLVVRDFRILWFGTVFSFVAFFMSMIVQSVVAFELAGTNTAVGYVVFSQGGAMAVFGPLGGAYADRWPKRRVVVIGQLITATVLVGLSALIAAELLRIEALIAAAFVMGTSFAFVGPARQSLVVDLVSNERRGNAMAVTSIANTGSRVLGPVVAGGLLAWPLAGAVGAYLTMSLFYIASALSLAWIPKSIVRAESSELSVWSSVLEGFSYVWNHPRLRLLVIFFMLVILIGFPHVTILPGLIENVYGMDSVNVSRLFAVSAVGALSASVLVARFADSRQAVVIYSGMALIFAAGLIYLAVSPDLELASWAIFAVGAGNGGFQALNAAVIARETEPEYMGRVMSLTMLAFAGFGLMALPFGILADRIGEQSTLMLMGVLVLLVSLVFGAALMRQMKDEPQ
jgi:MFS family permease